jgi:hypothetical protein
MKSHRLSLLLALIVALALAACGGDDDNSSTVAGTTDAPAGTTAPSTGATGPGSSKAKKGSKPARAQREGQDTSSGGAQSGGSQSGGAQSGGSDSKGSGDEKNSGGYVPPQGGSQGKRTALQRDLHRQASTVCKAFPLKVLARENRAKSTKPADIALAYSNNYIMGPRPGDRRAVYEGCIEGIKSKGNR